MGDSVWVDSMSTLGEVTALDGAEAEVQAGSFRVRVPIRSVMVRERAAARQPEPAEAFRFTPSGPRPPLELDIRGTRAEDALIRLDKYLNDAMLAGLPWVRIVHGKGTGVLRQIVRERLGSYPSVASFRAGENNEGGEGVTVVSFTRG